MTPGAPGATEAPPVRPGRREYLLALLVLGVGAVLILVAGGRTWGAVVAGGGGLPAVDVVVSGRDAAPEVAAMGLLALAGVAGLVATGRLGRAVIGALLVLAGLVAVVGSLAFARSAAVVLAAAATDRLGTVDLGSATATSWWPVAALGGVLVALAGLAAVVRGGRWPRLGARYDRVAGGPPAEGRPGGGGAPSSGDQWAALDRGEDPTA